MHTAALELMLPVCCAALKQGSLVPPLKPFSSTFLLLLELNGKTADRHKRGQGEACEEVFEES